MQQTDVKIGFMPLCDSAPLVVAKERGFFAGQGLSVELSREPSWSNIRDKLAYGFLDAAQMLATMPLSCALGLGNVKASLVAVLGLSCGGNAITLGGALLSALGGEVSAQALQAVLPSWPQPPRLAIPYPFSTHHYALNCWLAGAGIDPDRQVRLVVVPPPQMVAHLTAGKIDGFCAGEPWNSLAAQLGLGRVVASVPDFLPERIEKVLALRREWAEENPQTVRALVRALLAACRWSDAPENRAEVADILSRRPYLDASFGAVRAGLAAIRFYGGLPNRPDPVQAQWYLEQMDRWGHLPPGVDKAEVAQRVYRLGFYDDCLD
ncbi:bicarbonate transport ATP-binding protein CmpC [mine drainage metagenome]|uniref:Bicarbonate transport ATP-binding protein CmpC n=1 Tax=mine drainage metagenome TaxID=410659 RepID=A0A1J5QUN4_9ZZZZ